MQQINFTGNLGRDGNTTVFFITKEAKEMILDFLEYCIFFFVLIKYQNKMTNKHFKCKIA